MRNSTFDGRERRRVLLTAGVVACCVALAAWTSGEWAPFRRIVCTKAERAQRQVRALVAASNSYAAAHGGAPPISLEVLVAPDSEGRVFFKSATVVPVDPWRRRYVYFPPTLGQKARVVSYGRDGQPGGVGEDADIDSTEL